MTGTAGWCAPRVWLLAAALPVGYAGPVLRAATVDISCEQDNTLLDQLGTNSNGGDSGVYAGRDLVGRIKRGLMQFNVAAHVPVGSTVTGATLTLYMDKTIAGVKTVTLHRVLASWGEGEASGQGGGSPAGPGDATWEHRFFDTVLWDTEGGDFTASESASQGVGAVGFYSWTSGQLAADVQNMLDNPGSDFGWLIKGDESTPTTAKKFASREYPLPANRPKLSVTYEPPPPVSILQWRSVRTHGGTVDHAIVLDPAGAGDGATGPTVEARAGGVRRIEVDFSGPVSVPPGAVTVTGQTTVGGVPGSPQAYTPSSVAMVDADTAAIVFDPGQLPDQTCYAIDLSPLSVAGLTGDHDVRVRALAGDTTMSGGITLSDAILARLRLGTAVADGPQYDVDLDGNITGADVLMAKAGIGLQALCP